MLVLLMWENGETTPFFHKNAREYTLSMIKICKKAKKPLQLINA